MQRRAFTPSLVLALPLVFTLAACAGLPSFGKKKSDGLAKVDDLLSHVERVQVESVLCKQHADAALQSLRTMLAPEFSGDAVIAHAKLSESIDQSKTQAKKLAETIQPMKDVAAAVFEQWTANLESFGNTDMRERSQARMEETRARYEMIVQRGVAAQIAYDSFNANLSDHALFLAHDFNTGAVSAISDEIGTLDRQARQLDNRLNACVEATKRYVESAALRGQLAQSPENGARQRDDEPATTPRRRARAAEQAEATQGATAQTSPSND